MTKPLRLAQMFFAGCLLVVLVSQALVASRRFVPPHNLNLSHRLPAAIGDWTEIPTAQDVVDPSDSGAQDSANQIYDKVEYHTYRRADGTQVVLTLAYRRVQEQESKIHRPELCYFAQGFVISHPQPVSILTGGDRLPAVTFHARSPQRSETVVYWIRIGDIISTSAWSTRSYLVRLGLRRHVPDGLLVRASIESPPGADAAAAQADVATATQFLGRLADAAMGNNRAFLVGAP